MAPGALQGGPGATLGTFRASPSRSWRGVTGPFLAELLPTVHTAGGTVAW